jgi:hypothetical protein
MARIPSSLEPFCPDQIANLSIIKKILMNVYTIVLAFVKPNLRIPPAPTFRGSRHPTPSFFSRRIAANYSLLAAETP